MPDTTPTSRHVSTTVAASAAEVYALASDPARLSDWAAGLAATPLHQDGGTWVADAPFGRVTVEFAPPNAFGVLDHVVTMPDGEQVLNPMRVVPWGDDRCEVVFTVRQRAGMTDEAFAADAAAVAADLASLRALVERPQP
ncbi:SRPBCC family protein [Jatrophihabitans sp. YIM 134969]